MNKIMNKNKETDNSVSKMARGWTKNEREGGKEGKKEGREKRREGKTEEGKRVMNETFH